MSTSSKSRFIGRVSTSSGLDGRSDSILLSDGTHVQPAGFRAYFIRGEARPSAAHPDTYALGREYDYLADGDVVRIDPVRNTLHVLYRRNSPFNSFLVTERCDNYCVMCSQPPKAHDDSWIVDELFRVIPLLSPETREIGITGGEPGLLGGRLVELIRCFRDQLPSTVLHVLSNGRAFAKPDLSTDVAALKHPDLMFGIPLYADVPEAHDYVVQQRGAFDQTIQGILNLKRRGVRVELRFVIHRDTYEGLPAFARFVARNLLFVDHVALMGLELMGFARSNLDALWIDPMDYQHQLAEAVDILSRAGARVSIYNLPLCVLPASLHGVARASISDWKNRFFDECDGCAKKSSCAGFFASARVRRSRGISPFAA
jgi:His-Xaa-Ser system radical SAM maturase HxsC